MKNIILILNIMFVILLLGFNYKSNAQTKEILNQYYNLAGERIREPQFFILQTTITTFKLDGTRIGKDHFKLFLSCTPDENNKKIYKYTCNKFILGSGNSNLVTVPALENWSYIFGNTPTGYDKKGQIFGIEHSKFENLTDSNGDNIQQGTIYWVYNSFIDFHGMCNVFAEPAPEGGGIQNLTHINQEIVHLAANSEAPVNLGTNVEKGSYFKNGEIILTFTGLGIVNGAPCAIINLDSGESSFKMKMKPAPNMEITTTGSSHYKGNLFINTASFWVEKVEMNEFIVSETIIPGQQNKINSVAERETTIAKVDKSSFNEALKSFN